MASRPGKLQSAFTAGEIDPLMHERTELKYFGTGLAKAENIEIAPQGGFRNRDGLRDVGALEADAARLFSFDASDGESYDLVFRPAEFAVWSETALLDTVTFTGLTAAMLPEMTSAQSFDTMLVFHEDLETQRIKHLGPTDWDVDTAPYEKIPNWDYGSDIDGVAYTNGVSAVWEIEFDGLTTTDTVFSLTVSGQESLSVTYNSTMATLAALVETAIEDLANVATGIAVSSPGGTKLRITFSGAGNEGDGWAVSGRVVNKADAAITSAKITAGVAPGEPVMSADRGWPQCGAFYQQRLAIGGFKSLPNAWMFSATGLYYNFDEKNTEANGPALVPMNAPGGEIEHIVDNRFLLILSSQAEYWISERALSRSAPPNHVTASTHGTKRGVPVVQNEGAAMYVYGNGSVLGEFRYTDVEGNFVSVDASLLASHLMRDVVDQAQRSAMVSTDGNHLAMVKADGSALLATLLREQEVTAFTRVTSGTGSFKAVCRNGRNEISWIVQREAGRRLERFEDGLLLDEAVSFTNDPAQTAVTGLDRFDGLEVWAIADNNVFGPFVVTDGAIELPLAAEEVTVGSWAPPVVDTLPQDRTIGPGIVNKGKARIYAVTLSLIDTTSIAISTNGRPLQDVDLRSWGDEADVAELEAPFTGEIKVSGLAGWAEEPYVTISQLRPGRINVRSITVHAKL